VRRREFGVLLFGAGAASLSACGQERKPAGKPALIFAQPNEPTSLNTATSTAVPANFAATKIFDGLLAYNLDGSPRPQLATAWTVSPDGLTYEFQLRSDVKWHDGAPFTSQDVAYSLLKVWKVYHGRGRTTFAHVESVESPSPSVSIWRLSKPAPYLLSCLAASESTVLPKHLYDGAEVLTNPHNTAPVGTGPFRFVSWERGNQIVLERNPDYWDKGKPSIDRIVVRFLPDATATAIALETGAVSLVSGIPFSEAARLKKKDNLVLYTERASLSPSWSQFEFNLEKPTLQDKRVRHAFAHAIDRAFIAKNILGAAELADSPVPAELKEFHARDLPSYPFDLDRARALLDDAGLRPGADGVRLRLNLDFSGSATNTRTAAHIRSTLSEVGVDLATRAQDHGEYINRIYTRRDFDTCMTGSGAGRDPAVGVQRYYWSKNIKKGVAFSNGAAYVNPEVDRLLESAQVELDRDKRRALYADFQRIVMTDLPYIPLFWTKAIIGADARLGDVLTELGGLNSNFAGVSFAV
jgi:peptide/nickel transport system substrate-binding protein